MLGGDGIDASHTSVYGYRRRTTPFLERLAPQALLCERAFPNGATTGASLTSLLTGMWPTETGVIYPPDIARGEAAYLHLPGILRAHGYRTGQFTVRYYADAADFNLVRAFEVANGRRLDEGSTARLPGLDRLAPSFGFFLSLLGERLWDRASAGGAGTAAFDEASGKEISALPDSERLQALFAFVRESPRPFFAHIHLMGTHGARFFVSRQVFSAGREQELDWDEDFYDDSILDFDADVARIVGFLNERRILDRTIVVIYSDHGQNYTTDRSVPLLFLFPGRGHAGRISDLTQHLDIAPTLLDALGIPVPAAMRGRSLLRAGPHCRSVISAAPNYELVENVGTRWFIVPEPPFFSLGAVGLVDGRHRYVLDLASNKIEAADLPNPLRCPGVTLESSRSRLIEPLAAGGYDISSLRVNQDEGATRSSR